MATPVTSSPGSTGARTGGAPFVPDPSLLQQPIQLGMTGLRQLLQCYQVGSEEIKERLMNECDYIMECKVCRSLYRGLPNFLSHKRYHCQNNYPGSMLRFQDLISKEDENQFAGTAFRPTTEVALPTSQSPKKPVATASQLATFYKNIEIVGKTIAANRSTDQTIKLDILPTTQSAVAQKVVASSSLVSPRLYLFGKKTPEKVKAFQKKKSSFSEDLGKKRKADDGAKGSSEKIRRVDKSVKSGTGYKSESYPGLFKELTDFYTFAKLCDPEGKKCLICKDQSMNYKSFVTVRTHIDNFHLKVRNFVQCERCPLVFKVNRPNQFIKHLTTVHAFPMNDAANRFETARKVKKYLVNDRLLDIPGFDCKYATSRNQLYVNSGQAKMDKIQNVKMQKGPTWTPETMEMKQEFVQSPPPIPMPDIKLEPVEVEKTVTDDGRRHEIALSSAILSSLSVANLQNLTCMRHPDCMFQGVKLLKTHVMREHVKDVYQCPFCPERFMAKKLLAPFCRHLRKDHDVHEDMLPSIADKLQTSMLKEDEDEQEETTSDDHIYKAKPKGVLNYHCSKCERTFFSLISVFPHMKSAHGTTEDDWVTEREVIEKNVTIWTPATTRRQKSMVTGERTASIFNMDDIGCPFCTYRSPAIHGIGAHVKLKHNMSDEEAKKLKMEIKERKRLEKVKQTKSFLSNSPVKKAISGVTGKQQGNSSKSRRKQGSPLRSVNEHEEEKDSNDNTHKQSHESENTDAPSATISSPKNIIPAKRFTIQQCDHCHKVFGNEKFLLKHQKLFCKRGTYKTKEKEVKQELATTSEAKGDEKVDDSRSSPPEKGGPFRCWKCAKNFTRVQSMMIHTKYCQAAGPEGAKSGHESESSSDESAPIIYIKKPGSNKLQPIKIPAGNRSPRASSD